MNFTTLVPVRRNGGSKVSRRDITAIFQRFYVRFGACTVEGPTQGYWMDGGTLYQDECHKLIVACDEGDLADAEQLVRDIGRQLGQLAMYFEVDRTSDIRILRID